MNGNMDLVLAKQFNFIERLRLHFRADFFNGFNPANFDNPLNSIFGG